MPALRRARARDVEFPRGRLPLRHRRRLHRHAARRQPACGLHRRARDSGGLAPAARQGDELLRDGVRLAQGGGRSCPHPDLHADGRDSVRWAPGSRDRLRTCGAAATRRDPARDRLGSGAGAARAGGGTHRFGRMEQPIPTVEPLSRTSRSCSRALASNARSFRSRSTTTARSTSTSPSPPRTPLPLVKPDFARLAEVPAILGINTFAGSGSRWKTRMFAPGDGVPEDPGDGIGRRAADPAPGPPRPDRIR